MYSLPAWVDPAKIEAGKQFVRDNFFAVFFAHLVSLIFLLCYAPVRKVLVQTEKSDTRTRSLKRYLSTLVHIKSWYEQDILNENGEAAKDILRIRQVHARVSMTLSAKRDATASSVHHNSLEMIDNQVVNIDLIQPSPANPDSHITMELVQSIKSEFERLDEKYGNNNGPNLVACSQHVMSQLDMLVTQFCFVGFITTYPELFGILSSRDSAGIEGFNHLWALIGHLLGIQAEFNICLERNASKRKLVLSEILLPEFMNCHVVTVRLWKFLLQGVQSFIPFITLRAVLLFVCRLISEDEELGSPVSSAGSLLFQGCSLYDRLCYFLMNKCFSQWLRFNIPRRAFNSLLRLAVFATSLRHLRRRNGLLFNKISSTSWSAIFFKQQK